MAIEITIGEHKLVTTPDTPAESIEEQMLALLKSGNVRFSSPHGKIVSSSKDGVVIIRPNDQAAEETK